MLEEKLNEEILRFKSINKYTKTMIMEQGSGGAFEEPPLPNADELALPGGETALPGEEAPLGGTQTPLPGEDVAPLPGEDLGGEPPLPEDEGTEEIDITDLVNMTKNIKNSLDSNKNENNDAIAKMDSVFSKLDGLEQKLAQMDALMSKIDGLESKVEDMKEPTPVERLEMRSLDSYPFNQNPNDFFSQKQIEMKKSGKNQYVISKSDVSDYTNNLMRTSFNPEQEDDNFQF
jgi:polyhydroxyalkanoate synthesis regulator phasin